MRPLITHRWADIVFAHWRFDADRLRGLVPKGTSPDVVDGSAWAGLVAYELRSTAVGPVSAPGDLGRIRTVAIEVLTVDAAGSRGTAYRTLEVDNLVAVAAARGGLGVPYRAARVGARRSRERLEYRSRRAFGQARPEVRLDVDVDERHDTAAAPLIRLANRDGIHARHLGRTALWRREHPRLRLRAATLLELRGDLDAAAGLPGLFDRAPDSLAVATDTPVSYSCGGFVTT